MTDISKCQGFGCTKRESCYRFVAPAGIWQSWMQPNPIHCYHYWPIHPATEPADVKVDGGSDSR